MKEKLLKYILPAALYVLFFLAMAVFIREKRNYHLDEILTFTLSNNTYDSYISVYPEYNVRYDDPESVWLDRMTVRPGEGFNYKNVWERQAMDTHPPFYYVLIHTVSSFMPGRYSKWIGGGVNIFLALLSLFVFRKLLAKFIRNRVFGLVASCAFCFSAGVLSNVTYFRMYVMAMLFVLSVSFIYVCGLWERGRKFYVSLFLVSVAGALTHYYFLIYLFFISLAFGIFLLIKKQWKDVGLLAGVMALAGVAAYLIFPSIVAHSVGGGYRGNEVIANLKQSSLWVMMKECFAIVDKQLFSGYFILLIAISAVLTLIGIVFNWTSGRKDPFMTTEFEKHYAWIMLWFATVLYFVTVSKVTIFVMDRYFFPIYGVAIILFATALYTAFRRIAGEKIAIVMMALLLLVTTFKEFRTSFYYLYRSTQTLLDAAETHSDSDCIFVTGETIDITPAMCEVSKYNSVTFISRYEFNETIDSVDADPSKGLVVVAGQNVNIEEVAQKLYEKYPTLTGYDFLGAHSYTTSFYFHN